MGRGWAGGAIKSSFSDSDARAQGLLYLNDKGSDDPRVLSRILVTCCQTVCTFKILKNPPYDLIIDSIYIYIYIYWRLGESQPGNRFVSFVRASGRGEAKLRGRARGVSILVLGLSRGKSSPPRPKPCRGGVRELSL